MATPMKRWLALTLGGMAVAAITLWPPSQLEPIRRDVLPEKARYDALDIQLRSEVGVLQAMRWSDSLSALALATAVDGLALGGWEDYPEVAEPMADWRAAMRAYAQSLQPRDDAMVVGVYWQPAFLDQPPDTPASPVGGTQTYVGTRDGTPYCLQVRPVPVQLTVPALEDDMAWIPRNGLAECRLFFEYGVPGTAIQRWLEAGALRFGGRDDVPSPFPRIFASEDTWIAKVGPLFGMLRPGVVDRHPMAGRCIAGDTRACLDFLTSRDQMARWEDPEDAYVEDRSPLTLNNRSASPGAFRGSEDVLFADLETEFGPAAFARFWKSDREVPEAFEAAFGVDLGSWMRDWARSTVGVHYAGPGLRAGTALWSLLLLAALAGAACLVGARRRVA